MHSWRSKFAAESRNQQSPTINILQIKLEGGGNTRSQCGQASHQGLKGGKSSKECCDTCVSGTGDPSSSQQPAKDVSEKKKHQRSASTQSSVSERSKQQTAAANHSPVSPNGNKSGGSSQEKIGQSKSKTSPNSSRPTVNPKEIEKLTSDVDVQKKRQRFEGAAAAKNGAKAEKPRSQQPEPPPRRRSVKQNWQQVGRAKESSVAQ